MLVDAHTHRDSPYKHVRVLSLTELEGSTPVADLFAVGLHPWDLLQHTKETPAHILRWLDHPHCVAVGETGLDRVRQTPWELQLQWLQWHWDQAERLSLPIVLHAVRSSSDLLGQFKKRKPQTPWLWHDFAGPAPVVKSVLKLHPHMYFSFGPRAIQRKDFRELWEAVPTDRRLLETDDSGFSLSEVYKAVQPIEGVLETNFQQLFNLAK